MTFREVDVPSGTFIASGGNRPDLGSGPHMALMAAAVKLARQDLSNPLYSASASWWLRYGDLVELFAECLGIDSRRFLENA